MSLDEIAAKFGMTPNIVKSKLDYYKQLNGLTRKKQESARLHFTKIYENLIFEDNFANNFGGAKNLE